MSEAEDMLHEKVTEQRTEIERLRAKLGQIRYRCARQERDPALNERRLVVSFLRQDECRDAIRARGAS